MPARQITTIPNRYPGNCTSCGARVPSAVGQAWRVRGAGRWQVRHIPGFCPTITTEAQVADLASGQPVQPARRYAVETNQQVGEGYYRHQDNIYVVAPSRRTQRLYARRLSITMRGRARWFYAPGAMGFLREADLLTMEQATAIGHQWGICAICARTLTDPVSVQRGIGPVCARRLNGQAAMRQRHNEAAAQLQATRDARAQSPTPPQQGTMLLDELGQGEER